MQEIGKKELKETWYSFWTLHADLSLPEQHAFQIWDEVMKGSQVLEPGLITGHSLKQIEEPKAHTQKELHRHIQKIPALRSTQLTLWCRS